MKIKPFLKWAGGKFRLLDMLLPALPKGQRFVEPFVGSGAVFLNTNYPAYLLCDRNADLIALYSSIQNNGIDYIEYCHSFFTPENNTEEMFYAFRERFNYSEDFSERGALLLYLNRHAFNGLVRYNSKGGYNVPYGKYKKPYFPKIELEQFWKKVTNTDTIFIAQDFTTTFADLRQGDVVYADPPYVPLSTTAHFTAYSGNVFLENDQRDLAQLAQSAWNKGVPVIISNHDTHFTRELYTQASLQQFEVQRFISCQGSTRAKAPELLAAYA